MKNTDPVSAQWSRVAHPTTGVDGPRSGRRGMALSPSRASDFRQCPLLYRLRAIDRIPEPSSEAQVCGLIVHGVLERLYGAAPADRTREAAEGLVEASTAALVEERPDTAEMTRSGDVTAKVTKLLDAYFGLEDPTRLASVEVEQNVEVTTDGGVPLRGFIDRLDVAPDGALRVVDYKAAKPPSERFEDKVTYQLKLYALAIFLSRGVVPAVLRLMYLAGPSWLEIETTEEELRRFERRLTALWVAIQRAGASGHFPPKESFACRWCAHHALCPAKGGTPPPYPGWPDQQVAS